MIVRACVVLLMLIGAGLYTSTAPSEARVERADLAEFPSSIDGWQGIDLEPFDGDVVAKLGVDDYVNRVYSMPDRAPVALYIGYYDSQRQGDTIHSPQNCLPGAGWQPVESGRQQLNTSEGAVEVTATDGLMAVAIGAAAEISAREKRVVTMDELDF